MLSAAIAPAGRRRKQRKPQIVVASSAAIEVQAPSVLHTIVKVNDCIELRNNFIGGKVTIHVVSYPEESGMTRSNMSSLLYLQVSGLKKFN